MLHKAQATTACVVSMLVLLGCYPVKMVRYLGSHKLVRLGLVIVVVHLSLGYLSFACVRLSSVVDKSVVRLTLLQRSLSWYICHWLLFVRTCVTVSL